MVARAKVRFAAGDIWDAPDDGNRYEVIDGRLYLTPPPLWGHQKALSMLHILIGGHVLQQKLGVVVGAPTGVVLGEHTAVEPDLIYLSAQRQNLISERGIEGPPDLVVEALSRSTQKRDRTVKMRRYERAGIPHYWIVSPATRSLEAYRLGADGYELTGTFGPGAMFEPALFPGLAIAIDILWD